MVSLFAFPLLGVQILDLIFFPSISLLEWPAGDVYLQFCTTNGISIFASSRRSRSGRSRESVGVSSGSGRLILTPPSRALHLLVWCKNRGALDQLEPSSRISGELSFLSHHSFSNSDERGIVIARLRESENRILAHHPLIPGELGNDQFLDEAYPRAQARRHYRISRISPKKILTTNHARRNEPSSHRFHPSTKASVPPDSGQLI
ncbi:hypothetical protein VTI28DRAFT_8550 [Corynascus sepedonium]